MLKSLKKYNTVCGGTDETCALLMILAVACHIDFDQQVVLFDRLCKCILSQFLRSFNTVTFTFIKAKLSVKHKKNSIGIIDKNSF